MATSRTGTGAWKRTRDTIIAKARTQNAPCANPQCRQPLNYRESGQPNSPEVDHIIPVTQGGTNDRDNLQVLCRTCNRSKGDKVARNQPIATSEQTTKFPHSRTW